MLKRVSKHGVSCRRNSRGHSKHRAITLFSLKMQAPRARNAKRSNTENLLISVWAVFAFRARGVHTFWKNDDIARCFGCPRPFRLHETQYFTFIFLISCHTFCLPLGLPSEQLWWSYGDFGRLQVRCWLQFDDLGTHFRRQGPQNLLSNKQAEISKGQNRARCCRASFSALFIKELLKKYVCSLASQRFRCCIPTVCGDAPKTYKPPL